MTGGVEELGDQLAPAGQAEPGRVAAARADRGVQAQGQGSGRGPRVGKVEQQPRAFIAQVTEQGLVRPRVGGPPEHQGQVGLEQGPHRAGDEAHRIGAGVEQDPLGADLRHARVGQVAKGRDLGGDPPLGVVRAANDDGPAGVPGDDRLHDGAKRLGIRREPLDDQVGQHDPRDVGVLGLRPPDHLGRRPPELLERRLDLAEIDGDSLALEEGVGRGVGHRDYSCVKSVLRRGCSSYGPVASLFFDRASARSRRRETCGSSIVGEESHEFLADGARQPLARSVRGSSTTSAVLLRIDRLAGGSMQQLVHLICCFPRSSVFISQPPPLRPVGLEQLIGLGRSPASGDVGHRAGRVRAAARRRGSG